MKRVLNYFNPPGDSSYFNKLRINFFIRLCLIAIILLSAFLCIDFISGDGKFLFLTFSKLSAIVLFVVSLLLLKYKGIVLAGNIMSLGGVIVLIVFMNIIPEAIGPYFKLTHGFYSMFAYIIIGLLFANHLVIILNTGLTILSTFRIYYYYSHKQPELSEELASSSIHFIIVLLAVTTIIYYAQKFNNLSIQRADKELKEKEQKNHELLSSEEEIRAANEELVATTDALVEANEELTEAMKKAEESDNLKTEFLNNMSHEIRTPMNGIIGFSQLLNIPDLTESSRSNYINTIQSSSHQLLSIIDNIIEISKLGTKQVKVFEQQIDLNKMLHELYLVFENEIREKPVSLKLITALPEGNDSILIDEIKLYKILSNLLENGLKFTEQGLVEFGYQIITKHALNHKGHAIQFYVKDSGIGILPEKQEVIFNRFSQADSDLSRQFGGLGLGLSIAKENTELLQGKITLESERGKGSKFYVTIPYKPL